MIQPCVIFHHADGRDEHVIHGTAMRAQRNAAILGSDRATFHMHDSGPNVLTRLWRRMRGR